MKDVIISVSCETSMVNLSKTTIGNDGENLQGNFIFKFIDEFVEGQARLEYELNDKNYIPLNKVDNSYQVPIKNIITKKGNIQMQLVITEGIEQEEIPVFKSNIFYLRCNPSINAVTEAPDGYELWIERANAILNEMDNIDIDIESVGEDTKVVITRKDGTTKEATVSGGGGGTSDYEQLENLPKVNDVELKGNKTLEELGIQKKLIAGSNITIKEDGTISSTGGGGGSDDYEELNNKPSINGHELSGNKTTSELGLEYDDTKIKETINSKQDKLSSQNAGDNVTITEVDGIVKINSTGGSGGTSDFNALENRPKYNGTEMSGNTDVPEIKTEFWDNKQDKLISGTNIKTINRQSILGEGNITIEGGGSSDGCIKYDSFEENERIVSSIDNFNNVGLIRDDGTIDETRTSYITSDYIDISRAVQVYRYGTDSLYKLTGYAFYDENEDFLSYVPSKNITADDFIEIDGKQAILYELNTEAKYMRISKDASYSVLKYAMANMYGTYKLSDNIEAKNIIKIDNDVEKLKNETVKINEMYEPTYVDKKEIITKIGDESLQEKTYCDYTTGLIYSGDRYPNYVLSDFIPIKLGENYHFSYVHSVILYDDNKTYISGDLMSRMSNYTGNNQVNDYTIVNENAKYMRLNFVNDYNRYACCKISDNPYKILNFGDSLFGLNEKPFDASSFLQYKLGMKTANCGFGGTTASSQTTVNYQKFELHMLVDSIYNVSQGIENAWGEQDLVVNSLGHLYKHNLRLLKTIDFNEIDYITLAYGTNDWKFGVVGDNPNDKYDISTYKGSLRYSIEKIISAYPHIQICLCSPLFRNLIGDNENEDSDEWLNIHGENLPVFVNYMKEIADEYKLPFFNHYNDIGINNFNSKTFFRDGTHLTYLYGAKRLGEKLAGEIFSTSTRTTYEVTDVKVDGISVVTDKKANIPLAPIKNLIPVQASALNQLADKAFVNSSISTSTADFRGTFTDLQTLQSTEGDKNDYVYYNHVDSVGNTVFDRYKYVGSKDSKVPEGYIQYKALYTRDGNKLYIDTGVVLKAGYSIETKGRANGRGGNYSCNGFGVIDSNNIRMQVDFGIMSASIMVRYGSIYSQVNNTSFDENNDILLDANIGKINDTPINFVMPNIADNYNLYLFRINNKGTPGNTERGCYLEEFIIRDENGELVRDFVPCKNNAGRIGMYDTVTENFFGDVGGLNFNYIEESSDKWEYEYSLNNSSFTSEQWATINSGLVMHVTSNGFDANKIQVLKNINGTLTWQDE